MVINLKSHDTFGLMLREAVKNKNTSNYLIRRKAVIVLINEDGDKTDITKFVTHLLLNRPIISDANQFDRRYTNETIKFLQPQ